MKFSIGTKALAILAVVAGSVATQCDPDISTPLCCSLTGTVDSPPIAAILRLLGLTLTPGGLKVGVLCIPDDPVVGVCPPGRTPTCCNGVLLAGVVGTGCTDST